MGGIKGKSGARNIICEEIIKKLEEAFANNSTNRLACEYANISYECFRLWMLKAEKFIEDGEENIYTELSRRTKAAKSGATMHCLGLIKSAAPQNWQAAAWILERRYPQEYGRKIITNELTGTSGQPYKLNLHLEQEPKK